MKSQIVNKIDSGKYFYKERDGRSCTDVYRAASDICTVERYYCQNKSIPSLQNLIV